MVWEYQHCQTLRVPPGDTRLHPVRKKYFLSLVKWPPKGVLLVSFRRVIAMEPPIGGNRNREQLGQARKQYCVFDNWITSSEHINLLKLHASEMKKISRQRFISTHEPVIRRRSELQNQPRDELRFRLLLHAQRAPASQCFSTFSYSRKIRELFRDPSKYHHHRPNGIVTRGTLIAKHGLCWWRFGEKVQRKFEIAKEKKWQRRELMFDIWACSERPNSLEHFTLKIPLENWNESWWQSMDSKEKVFDF